MYELSNRANAPASALAAVVGSADGSRVVSAIASRWEGARTRD